jgi:hypothetical protein
VILRTAKYLAFLVIVLFHCSVQTNTDAGSSVAGNARVVGSLSYNNGDPAINAHVTIIPANYNPLKDSALPLSRTVTTDLMGRYSFELSELGNYNVFASDSGKKNVLIKDISFFGKPLEIPSHPLRIPGVIKVMLPQNVDLSTGYVYLPGTTISADVGSENNGYVIISGVPVDSSLSLSIVLNEKQNIIKSIDVLSEDTTIITNTLWSHKRRLIINTTASGANVKGNLFNFPLKIRLENWNFAFNEVKQGGDDIRFSSSKGALLPYEIEHWDVSSKYAEIWVKVDTIFGNNSSQYILMYWGNSEATGLSNGTTVFDTSNGFQGVWHLSEADPDSAYDATFNHYNGFPHFDESGFTRSGQIETGRFFNGTGCIIIPNSIDSKLNSVQTQAYTVSAWVLSEIQMNTYQVITGGDRFSLNLNPFYKTMDSRWGFVSRIDSSGLFLKSVIDNNSSRFGEWNYIVGVNNGNEKQLYINGKRVLSPADTANIFPITENYFHNFAIGGVVSLDPTIYQDMYCFNGYIDEVRVSNVARGEDWIKLDYLNQQISKSLVIFGLP